MDKKILKGVSVGATVVGAIITIVGSLASAKVQDIELDEKVAKAVESLKVD